MLAVGLQLNKQPVTQARTVYVGPYIELPLVEPLAVGGKFSKKSPQRFFKPQVPKVLAKPWVLEDHPMTMDDLWFRRLRIKTMEKHAI